MNKASPTLRLGRLLLLLLVLALIAVVGMIYLWHSLPADIFRKDINFEDAQRLVSFPICTPTYMPAIVDAAPQIVYESDAANIPEETYLRLQYKYIDSRRIAFEVYQRYTNTSALQMSYLNQESVDESAVINMVWWVSSPNLLSELETSKAVEQAVLDKKVFQTQQIIWWLYEIVDPNEYRSTMTHWIRHHVEYRVHTYLSVSEIEKVTLSMFDCLDH